MNSHLCEFMPTGSPQLVELWSCVSSPLMSHTPHRRRTCGSGGATRRGVWYDLGGVSPVDLRQGWSLVRFILIFYFVIRLMSAFRPGGSLDRRVNCRCMSQPRWVGAIRSTKGGRNRQRGNPQPSCCPAPRSGALAVGGYKRPRGRERERARALCVGPFSRAANLLVREPWTFLL
jgi:hypothetical protein